MTQRERITRAVYEAVDDLNGLLPPSQRLAKAPDTPVLGPAASLDSLGLINFIASTQQKIEEALGVRLTLIDGDFLIGGPERVSTLDGLIAHIEAKLDERGHV